MPANPTRLALVSGALASLLTALCLFVFQAPFATARTRTPGTPGIAAPGSPAASTASAAAASGSFAFLAMDGDRPTRYDPCTPIHYVVNLSEAPAGALSHIEGAIARLTAVTGLSFVYDGETDEIPATHRGLAKNPRYHGWPPVLISWVRTDETDLFSGGAIGEGGSTWYGVPGDEVYVTGVIALDSTQNGKLQAGFGGNSMGAVLMHELGHLVGLDHVADRDQMMFATVTDKPAAWADGDLAGLSQLGRAAGCLKVPHPPWTR